MPTYADSGFRKYQRVISIFTIGGYKPLPKTRIRTQYPITGVVLSQLLPECKFTFCSVHQQCVSIFWRELQLTPVAKVHPANLQVRYLYDTRLNLQPCVFFRAFASLIRCLAIALHNLASFSFAITSRRSILIIASVCCPITPS